MKNSILKTEMTWKRVIILALASAVITAALNCIPALEGTSFADPAESLEIWIVLAVYIIINCRGYKDASLKTFVFFLISQPLIYLLEVPFKAKGWQLFQYYPYWGMFTLLTIPGAAIAYRVKKDDLLSAAILSVANGLMIFTGIGRIGTLTSKFPHQLLAVLFCFIMPFVMIFLLFKQKKSRILAVVLAVLLVIAGVWTQIISPGDNTLSFPLEEGSWTLEQISDLGINVGVDEYSITVSSHKNGVYKIILREDSGKKIVYEVTVQGVYHNITVAKPYEL